MKSGKPKKKSGFQEGRSKTGPSRLTKEPSSKRREQLEQPSKKFSKKLAKLDRAKEDLLEVLGKRFEPAQLVGKKIKRKRDDEDIEDDGDDLEEHSMFESQMSSLRKMIGVGSDTEFNADAANKMLLRGMLATTMDLIPVAEKAFRQTKKEQAGYVYSALQNQARELATELKMGGDAEGQATFIRQSILSQVFKAMIQNLMTEVMAFNSIMEGYVRDPKTIKRLKRSSDDIIRNLGKFINQSEMKIANDITSYLSGDMTFFNQGVSKARKRRGGGKREER